jgi:hypothetical protein
MRSETLSMTLLGSDVIRVLSDFLECFALMKFCSCTFGSNIEMRHSNERSSSSI